MYSLIHIQLNTFNETNPHDNGVYSKSTGNKKKVLCTMVEVCLACPMNKTKNNAFIITFGTYVRAF